MIPADDKWGLSHPQLVIKTHPGAGIKVVMAGGPADAKGLLLAAIQDPDPVIFFEPKMM